MQFLIIEILSSYLLFFWESKNTSPCSLYSLTSFCLLLKYLASEILPSTSYEMTAPAWAFAGVLCCFAFLHSKYIYSKKSFKFYEAKNFLLWYLQLLETSLAHSRDSVIKTNKVACSCFLIAEGHTGSRRTYLW